MLSFQFFNLCIVTRYGPWQIEPDAKPKTAMKLVTLLPNEKIIGIHIIGVWVMPYSLTFNLVCVFVTICVIYSLVYFIFLFLLLDIFT